MLILITIMMMAVMMNGGDDGDVKVQTSPKVWCNERFLSQEDGEVLYSSSERDSLWNGQLAPGSSNVLHFLQTFPTI